MTTDSILSSPTGVNCDQLSSMISEYGKNGLETFDYDEHKSQDIENDIDPENNFFININNNCCYYTEDQYNRSFKSDNTISIIHFNSRSLYANFQNIKEYLSHFKKTFNVIAISETWISPEKGLDFHLDGYDLTYMNRKNKTGGGVALFVDKCFGFKVVENMSTTVDNIFECITIEIFVEKKKNVIVSCIYRAPGSNIEILRDWMGDVFTKTTQKVMFLCGDFNVDLLNPKKHRATEDFINTIYSMSLYPTITRPSRITTHGATLIDNIFTNNMEWNSMSGLLINDISDHLPVFLVYECKYRKIKDSNCSNGKRVRTEESITTLKNELLKQNWNIVYEEDDTDKAYETFLNKFNSLYDKNCPIKHFSRKQKHLESPWITKGLQNACKKKNTLYKKFIRLRTIEAEMKYKKYKNKLIYIMRKCKKEYYNKILENNKNNTKGLWNVLNSIIRNGSRNNSYPQYFVDNDKTIKKMDDVVNGFNKFFVCVGPELADKINVPESDNEVEYVDRNPSAMFLGAVDEKEIIDIVNKCKGKTSTDCNGIDMKIVKEVIEVIAKPLSHICNLSFRTGKFPSEMKTAKVIPLYKSGDRHHFTNYRPVSLLSQFSKILEKLFIARLDTFLDKHNLIIGSQYGFRSNRSTSLALLELIEEITNCIDKKMYAMGVFIDLKKAFDTIDHNLLLDKLERYGIRGVGLNWVSSYLSNRHQFVNIGMFNSSCLEITCGVPQGSVLGPKLFILYINDIVRVSKIMKFVLFADDTTIFCAGEDLQQLLKDITIEMEKLKRWFDRNKLSLNLDKTKSMLFGNYNTNIQVEVIIDNIVIERVYENKFLGVILDYKISWKPHIKYISAKLARSIAVIGKTRQILDQKSLHTLYYSLVLPYLSYCVEVWGNTYRSNLQQLHILQKRAIRIINNAGYRDHTNNLFLKAHALKFMDLIEFRTAQIMYKARNKLLPGNLQKMFLDREGGYNLRDKFNLKKIYARTTMKSMCISCCGVNLWNGLELELQQSLTIHQFKNIYKNKIFKKYIEEESG